MAITHEVSGVIKLENGKLATAVVTLDAVGDVAAGGGAAATEYTEGDSDASATGPALLTRDTDGNLYVPSPEHPANVRQEALQRGIDMPGGPLTPVSVQATASGNTTVHDPAAGKVIRVHRIEGCLSTATVVTVGFREGAAGTIHAKKYLAAIGQPFSVNLGSDYWTLAADALLIVNLSGVSQVELTAWIEEITP